ERRRDGTRDQPRLREAARRGDPESAAVVRIWVALVAALALVVAAPALASEQHPTQSEMEAELVCPTGHTTLDLSDSPAAQDIKDYVAKRIAEGATKSQIKSELVAQLGPSVLAVPRTHGFDLLAWLLPFLGVAVGAVVLGAAAWYWSRNRSADGGLS